MYKMQRLEVSGAVRLIYRSSGVKGLSTDVKNSDLCPGIPGILETAVSPMQYSLVRFFSLLILTPETKTIFSCIEITVHNGIQEKRIYEERRCLRNHRNRVFGIL